MERSKSREYYKIRQLKIGLMLQVVIMRLENDLFIFYTNFIKYYVKNIYFYHY